jgi:hypothetical protein
MDVGTWDALPFGFSWTVAEAMERTSHALAHDGRVWLIDPTDAAEALDRAAALGTPAAVVQLLDRHNRDCAAIAARLGVPHLKVPETLPDAPFTVVPVIRRPGWREAALWWPGPRALVVAETVGTSAFWRAGHGAAGIHLLVRAFPPGALRGYQPEHLLVGHGAGIHGPEATRALEFAYAHARRDLPRALAQLPGLLARAR